MLMDAIDLGKCYRRFGGRMNFYMYKRRKNILDRYFLIIYSGNYLSYKIITVLVSHKVCNLDNRYSWQLRLKLISQTVVPMLCLCNVAL